MFSDFILYVILISVGFLANEVIHGVREYKDLDRCSKYQDLEYYEETK